MEQILHGSAPTPARYGINPETVAKWAAPRFGAVPQIEHIAKGRPTRLESILSAGVSDAEHAKKH
jgi:hypothetical protein